MGLSLGGLPKTAGENADIDTEVGMLMTEFDSNQDGSVSRDEFKTSLERCWKVTWTVT
jgi:Ca2+-binding EF-hand superfamily protein